MALSEAFYALADAIETFSKAVEEGFDVAKKIEPVSMYSYTDDGEMLWVAGSSVTAHQYDASTTLFITNSMGHFEVNLQPRQRKELIEALLEHHEKHD